MQILTGDTTVTLTIDPHGPFPVTMDAERYDVVHDALFTRRGIAYRLGLARLTTQGAWTFTVDDDGYRMQVA